MPWLSTFDIRQLDDTYFLLLDNLVYYSSKHGIKIVAPVGLISDGPSVPRAPYYILVIWAQRKKSSSNPRLALSKQTFS